MEFLNNLFHRLFGGEQLQPATPHPALQQNGGLTENIQPASGPVPVQNAANPMSLPSTASIGVARPNVVPVSLSGAGNGVQPQPLNIAQMLQPAQFGPNLQPASYGRDLQPTMRGRRIQTTVAPEFLQKAVQIDQSGD